MSTPTIEPPAEATRLILKTDPVLLGEMIPILARFFYRDDLIKELAPGLLRIKGGSTTVPDHRLAYTSAFKPHHPQAEISAGKGWEMIGPTNAQILEIEKNGWRSLMDGPPDVGNDGTISGAATMQKFVDDVFFSRHNASNPTRLRDRHACSVCDGKSCGCKKRPAT